VVSRGGIIRNEKYDNRHENCSDCQHTAGSITYKILKNKLHHNVQCVLMDVKNIDKCKT